MKGSAVFSDDKLHRYELRRVWNPRRPPYCAIMLNPSTADAHKNDPTVLRQIKRAVALGYGSLIVLNVGAGRNTDPKKWAAMRDPIGPRNLDYIRAVLIEVRKANGIVVAGWGNLAPYDVVRRIVVTATRCNVPLYCLGLTNEQQPIHPLYISYKKEPELWLPAFHSPNQKSKSNASKCSRRTGPRVRLS